MINKSHAQENILYDIESEAIKIIENKSDVFFNSCSCNAYAYSFMLVEHVEYYSKDSFEFMVLSSKKIMELIKSIINEINIISNNNSNINLLFFNRDLINNIEFNPVLEPWIKEFTISSKITIHCEDTINKTISQAFNSEPTNQIISNLIKSKNIGGFILGENNYKNLQSKHKKEIYNQIVGMLLNIKCFIRNNLVNHLIETLKINELQSTEEFKITA